MNRLRRREQHRGTQSHWLHTIIEAKMAKRWIGLSPVRVVVSEPVMAQIEAECEAAWIDNPRRLYDMEVVVRPDVWFDLETEEVADLSGYSWG